MIENRFVLRRVIDDVFADEFERVVRGVELRHAHSARGQRNAEPEALRLSNCR